VEEEEEPRSRDPGSWVDGSGDTARMYLCSVYVSMCVCICRAAAWSEAMGGDRLNDEKDGMSFGGLGEASGTVG
jgi:hypothetical protein